MRPASTQVTTLLKQFGLTTAAEELVPRLTQAGHHDALPVLVEVFEAEAEARRQRRIARLRRASRLPPGKTFETLDTGRLPAPILEKLKTLASGAFLETATNVLAFGLPGVGKSHALCAVGHALVEAGHSVLCVPAYALRKRPDEGYLGDIHATIPFLDVYRCHKDNVEMATLVHRTRWSSLWQPTTSKRAARRLSGPSPDMLG